MLKTIADIFISPISNVGRRSLRSPGAKTSVGRCKSRRSNPPAGRVTSFAAPTSVCCYDAETGRLVCPGSTRVNGSKAVLLGLVGVDTATPKARVQMPDGRMRLVPLCPASGLAAGSGIPGDCCYDPSTGKLVCSSSMELNGQDADVVTEFVLPDGRKGVSVAVANGDNIRVPYCRPPTKEPPTGICCVNEKTMRIECDDTSHPWHGVDVSLVASCYDDPTTGARLCFVDISGDANTILPVCDSIGNLTWDPGTDEPPSYDCCFMKSTMTIICADASAPLHGIVVPAATVSFGGTPGNEWAEVNLGGDEKQRMPVCDEPGFTDTPCPPGTTRDPITGLCSPPTDCPPGQVRDPITGFCSYDTPVCPPGQQIDPITGLCGPIGCPPGMQVDPMTGECYFPPPVCPPGSTLDPATNQCIPPGFTCPPGMQQDIYGNCFVPPPPPGEDCCDSCSRGGCCESACPGGKG